MAKSEGCIQSDGKAIVKKAMEIKSERESDPSSYINKNLIGVRKGSEVYSILDGKYGTVIDVGVEVGEKEKILVRFKEEDGTYTKKYYFLDGRREENGDPVLFLEKPQIIARRSDPIHDLENLIETYLEPVTFEEALGMNTNPYVIFVFPRRGLNPVMIYDVVEVNEHHQEYQLGSVFVRLKKNSLMTMREINIQLSSLSKHCTPRDVINFYYKMGWI